MIEISENLMYQMLEEWEEMQDSYYPDRRQLQGFLTSILPRLMAVELILDLSVGAGSLSKKMLDDIPGAKIIGIDSDDVLLEMARFNLKDYGEYFKAEKRDLWNTKWSDGLPENFDAVVSSYGLKFLTDPRRLEIYQDIYKLLKIGGIFICIDEVKSSIAQYDLICAETLSKYRESSNIKEKFQEWQEFWDKVGNRLGKKSYSSDLLKFARPESLDGMGTLFDQLILLKKAGFSEVECFYKDLSCAVYGGMKNKN